MMNGKKVVVVMPAYNAAATLERTYAEVPKDIVDEVIDYIKSTGLRYEVGPFETSLCEGRQRRGAFCPPAVKN